MPDYSDLFRRNLGVFTEAEQEKIRNSRVLIVGCGGIGGTVAVILARSGVSRFILVDFDSYEPSNMNRQIECFDATLGRNKAEVLAEAITRINPEAEVVSHGKYLSNQEVAGLMDSCDLVFPAADDFAFSLLVFRDAKSKKKPALFVVPSGTWANVSILLPEGPTVEDLQGIPALATYDQLSELFTARRYKFGTIFYIWRAGWRKDYYRDFMDRDAPVAQICPTVWMSSALGAGEVLKALSGRRSLVAAPRFWVITEKSIKVCRLYGANWQTVLILQRKFFYRLFQTPLAGPIEKAQALWWKFF
ncbi:MAG: ThiF family adenylyltransferase [Thermodesulfobacteriota bacterium]